MILYILIIAAVAAIVSLFGLPGTEVNKVRNLKQAPPAVRRWNDTVKKAATKFNLPPEIIMAVIWQESLGDPNATGSAGEKGLMQIKPIAAEDILKNGYQNYPNWQTNPKHNIMAGSAYLALQLRRTGKMGNAIAETKTTALESYNEGYSKSKEDFGADEYAQEVISKAQKLGYGNV